MNSGFWPKEKFLLGMTNDCLRPVSRLGTEWAYHDGRCGFSLPATEPRSICGRNP